MCTIVIFLKLLSDYLLFNTDTKIVLQVQKTCRKLEEFVKKNALNVVNEIFVILSTWSGRTEEFISVLTREVWSIKSQWSRKSLRRCFERCLNHLWRYALSSIMQIGLLRMLWYTWFKYFACDVTRIDTDPLQGNLILNPKLRRGRRTKSQAHRQRYLA